MRRRKDRTMGEGGQPCAERLMGAFLYLLFFCNGCFKNLFFTYRWPKVL